VNLSPQFATTEQARKPIDQAREEFHSTTCSVCGGIKKDGYFFCLFCEKKLPWELRMGLRKRLAGWTDKWLSALAMLKKDREK